MKEININFQKLDVTGSHIIDTRYIEFPKEKLWNFFDKKINFNIAEILIDDLIVDDSIVINSREDLVTINIDGEKSNKIDDFKPIVEKTRYEIQFDPKQIKDYSDFENNEKVVSFVLKVKQDSNGDYKKIASYEIKLFFIKANSKPHFNFNLTDEFKNGKIYSKSERIKIGELEIESKSDYFYSNELDCIASIHHLNDKYKKAISLGKLSEIRESNPVQGSQGGLVDTNDENVSDISKSIGINSEIILRKIKSQNMITIPVFANLLRLENPVSGQEIHDFRILLSYNDKSNTEKIEKSFVIKQDTTETSLLVHYYKDDPDNFIVLNNGEIQYFKNNVKWLKSKESSRDVFVYEIGNYSVNGSAEESIAISDFKIDFRSNLENENDLICKDGLKLNELFKYRYEDQEDEIIVKDIPKEFLFKSNRDDRKKIQISFEHANILEINNNVVSITCTISFKHSILPDGEIVEHNNNIHFNIEKDLGNYWLALDFGTSAIVAAFDKGNKENPDLLDLQSCLSKYNYIPTGYNKEQIDEFETKFLSSQILLKDNHYIDSDIYHEDVIMLSPTKGSLMQNTQRVLPNLKSLIGSKKITDYNSSLKDFKYYLNKEDENIYKLEYRDVPVNQIIQNAYKLVLRDFIKPLVKDMNINQDINKLVLTVPNSFTPLHNDLLKKLIRKEFPLITKDYILFLSESDAVACHYDSNWSAFNTKQSLINKYRPQGAKGEEYIVVYDMGAGTLDLTYFKITKNEDGTRKIKILGRLGKTTAGNYFDYLLARNIHTAYNQYFKKDLFEPLPKTAARSDAFKRKVDFKKKVKEVIKPKLSDKTGTITLEENESFMEDEFILNIEDILDLDEVKAYIKSNTFELFENFFHLYKYFDSKNHVKGTFPIDTILMTGRGSRLEGLAENVLKSLADWSMNDKNEIELIKDLDTDKLKSAVVQGALNYAALIKQSKNVEIENPNLQSRYGLLYKPVDDSENDWKFLELLNPSTKPINETQYLQRTPTKRDGVTIYEYDTDMFDAAGEENDGKGNFVNLSATIESHFVQSFSSQPAKTKNKEHYNTTISSFDTNDIAGDNPNKVRVRIKIDEENRLQVKVGADRQKGIIPLNTNLKDNQTIINSMYPFFES